jgi:hypothetical protein
MTWISWYYGFGKKYYAVSKPRAIAQACGYLIVWNRFSSEAAGQLVRLTHQFGQLRLTRVRPAPGHPAENPLNSFAARSRATPLAW